MWDGRGATKLFSVCLAHCHVRLCSWRYPSVHESSSFTNKAHFYPPPQFMAPEMLFGESYDEKADVFSFGVTLWELMTRRLGQNVPAPPFVTTPSVVSLKSPHDALSVPLPRVAGPLEWTVS